MTIRWGLAGIILGGCYGGSVARRVWLSKTSDPLPLVPAVLHQRTRDGEIQYHIQDKIGSGGFGTVYAGIQKPGDIPIAIKCVAKSRMEDNRVREKIASEVEIQRSVNHPNIVQFRAVFQDSNYVYLLLELCERGNVLEVLKREKRFDEERTARIMHDVLQALAYLHQNRIIHRDLKLQNLMYGRDGLIKLGDFGLSAKFSEEDEKRMTMCGTPGFLSPEVLAHREGQTPSVDIWAVGVCAYLMLTGKPPFQSKDRQTTYRKIRHCEYEWPPGFSVTPFARSFVESCLLVDAAARPQARVLLDSEFIRRYARVPTVPVSVAAAAAAAPDVVEELPPWTVQLWWDYSEKYGLAYILRCGNVGACFNDGSRAVVSMDDSVIQYWVSSQAEMLTLSFEGMDESPHRKKLLLLRHFARQLRDRVAEPVAELKMPESGVMPHVKYWARSADREGVLFRMVDRNLQANFPHHVKLVIDSQNKLLYYVTEDATVRMPLAALRDRTSGPDVRERFAMLKVMARRLT